MSGPLVATVVTISAPGDLAGDPAYRSDQLGHGVLTGHRGVQHGRVQRPAGLSGHRPGLGDHPGDDLD